MSKVFLPYSTDATESAWATVVFALPPAVFATTTTFELICSPIDSANVPHLHEISEVR